MQSRSPLEKEIFLGLQEAMESSTLITGISTSLWGVDYMPIIIP